MSSTGVNAAERYLSRLCRKTFLSLWSHSNVYKSPGEEFADLLVVCGNDVIIFQDKWSSFPRLAQLEASWQRWLRRAVLSAAKQLWGAERHIKSLSRKLFLDASCNIPFPLALPDLSKTKFHLILVTHGGSEACRNHFGGSGSFMFDNGIQGFENHKNPFVIGDLDRAKTFIHVLDDTSLDILMRTLDTITDLTNYLKKREILARSNVKVLSTGEEELLANYLKNLDSDGVVHDFDFGKSRDGEEFDAVGLMEGGWEEFQKHPQRIAQLEQDKVSYFWDYLIEEFSRHAVNGTQYVVATAPPSGITGTERILRFMAREPRFVRRAFTKGFLDMVKITRPEQRRLKIIRSYASDGVYYVFLLFPIPSPELNFSYDDYRQIRAAYLEKCCMVTKLEFPDAIGIVGIATESGDKNSGHSEDAMFLDVSLWSQEMQRQAEEYQTEFKILTKPTETPSLMTEYPDVVSKKEFLKNPYNKPCPCGSEKKYKKCCGLKGRKFYK